jgi:hypothetical protein
MVGRSRKAARQAKADDRWFLAVICSIERANPSKDGDAKLPV